MDDIIQEISEMKKILAQKKQQADKAAGALEQNMLELKKTFDCDTIEEAEKKKDELEKKKEKLEKRLSKSMNEFKEKWADLLGLT